MRFEIYIMPIHESSSHCQGKVPTRFHQISPKIGTIEVDNILMIGTIKVPQRKPCPFKIKKNRHSAIKRGVAVDTK